MAYDVMHEADVTKCGCSFLGLALSGSVLRAKTRTFDGHGRDPRGSLLESNYMKWTNRTRDKIIGFYHCLCRTERSKRSPGQCSARYRHQIVDTLSLNGSPDGCVPPTAREVTTENYGCDSARGL